MENQKVPLSKIAEKNERISRLCSQLERQLFVEDKYGIKAHEISKIRLIPTGKRRRDPSKLADEQYACGASMVMTYHSLVTMKNGDERFISGVNIKKLLDEGVNQ